MNIDTSRTITKWTKELGWQSHISALNLRSVKWLKFKCFDVVLCYCSYTPFFLSFFLTTYFLYGKAGCVVWGASGNCVGKGLALRSPSKGLLKLLNQRRNVTVILIHSSRTNLVWVRTSGPKLPEVASFGFVVDPWQKL